MVKNFIFLGPPGVGKGTIAKIVAKEKKLVHISTGDIFRKHIKEQTTLGKKVKEILDNGSYVPDEITNEIIKKRLSEKDVLENGCILDGFPRTINQAEFLKKLPNCLITAAVFLKASDETIKERLIKRAKEENREDDTPSIIAKRIKIYYEKTNPLIDWYKSDNFLTKIDSSGTIEENVSKFYEVFYK